MNGKRIKAVLVVVLIQVVSIGIYLIFKALHFNLYIPAFIISSFIAQKIYKNSTFWKIYWNIIKFPLYILTIILELILTLFHIIYFQYIAVIATAFLCYFLTKFTAEWMEIKISDEFLLYMTIVMISIFCSLKRSEKEANKGYRRGFYWSKKSNKKKDDEFCHIMKYIHDVSTCADFIVPTYSSEKMRYTIYLFNFILVISSNIISYADVDGWIKIFANSQVINGAVLTFFAFDNLYNNRKLLDDLNKKRFKTILSVINHRSRRAVYGVSKNNK